MIALLGALREEIVGLLKQTALEEAVMWRDYHIYRGKYGSKNVLLVQTGLGKERAERATEFILEHYPITGLISLGFAGALTEESKVSEVILCSTLYCGNGPTDKPPRSATPYHSDANLISLASQTLGGTTTRFRQANSVTVTQPVSRPEAKRALGKACCAEVADMESYWVARIASARHVPFLAIRVISDTMQDSLPPFDQILDSSGKWYWHKAVPYFVWHPQHVMKLVALYRNTRQARKSLTAFVGHIVAKM